MLADLFNFNFFGWCETESTRYIGHYLAYLPALDDKDEAIGGMRIGRGNQISWRKPAPVPLCPPQIPHDLTQDRTWATEARNR
jgi:hypothetical protein